MKRLWTSGIFVVTTMASLAWGQAPAPKAPLVDLSRMVDFPASTFLMGYPDETPGAYGDVWFVDQQPQHSVQLSAFKLDTTEVTIEEFALFLSYAGAHHYSPLQPVERVRDGYLPVRGTERQPMRQVNWQAAADYCVWAGKRLPTEAEWERAAAGTDRRPYPWGATGLGCGTANYFTGSAFCESGPAPVQSRPAGNSPEGVADLAGNVAEWTADYYGTYSAEAQTDPRGPATGPLRVVRGGSFLDGSISVRSHARWGAPASGRADSVGFRCAWNRDEGGIFVRGPLSQPADIDRQPSSRPLAPAASEPDILVEGLRNPGNLVRWNDSLVLAENGRGRVLRINGETQSSEELVSGLSSVIRLGTDGVTLVIADQGNGSILRLGAAGGLVTVAQGETQPGPIVVGQDAVFWATPTAVRGVRQAGGAVEELIAGLDGVLNLALTSTHVYGIETGAADLSKARIFRTSRQGGAIETVADSRTWGTGTRATDLVVEEGGNKVYFALSGPNFPNVGRICEVGSLRGGSMKCLNYSPPVIDRLVKGGSYLYWGTRSTLTRTSITGQGPFDHPGPWTRPGGIWADERQVIWTDGVSGRLLRVVYSR